MALIVMAGGIGCFGKLHFELETPLPVAIIITPDAIPAILEEPDAAALFAAVIRLAVVPDQAKASPDALRTWLAGLPKPSGWFVDVDAAQRARDTQAVPSQEDEKERMWGVAIALAGSGRFEGLDDLQAEMKADYPKIHGLMSDERDLKRLRYVRELIFKRNRDKG